LAPKPAPPRPPKHPAPKPGGKPGGGGITVGGKHISSRTLLVGGLALGVLVFLYIRNRNANTADTGASTLAPSGIDPLSGSGTDQGGGGSVDVGQVTPPDFAPDPVFIPSPFPTPAGGGGLPPAKPAVIPSPLKLPPAKTPAANLLTIAGGLDPAIATAVAAHAASSPVTTTAGVSLAPPPPQAATGTHTAGF
jgi:hypothetical protein